MSTTAKAANDPKSPAKVLRELLRSQGGMCQAELARALGLSEARVSLILNERRPFTPEIALRLQRAFGTPAADWLRLQAEFDLWREEKRLSGEINALPEPAA
jgi:antitoxin HigA-1